MTNSFFATGSDARSTRREYCNEHAVPRGIRLIAISADVGAGCYWRLSRQIAEAWQGIWSPGRAGKTVRPPWCVAIDTPGAHFFCQEPWTALWRAPTFNLSSSM